MSARHLAERAVRRDRSGPDPRRVGQPLTRVRDGGHVDVIERADESGERLYAELGADRPARVALPANPEGPAPYG